MRGRLAQRVPDRGAQGLDVERAPRHRLAAVDVAQRDADRGVARRDVDLAGDAPGEGADARLAEAGGERDVGRRVRDARVVGALGGQDRVELQLALLGAEPELLPADVDGDRVVERRAVGLLELDRRLADREVADVEAARLHAGRDALLGRRRRLGRRGDGEDEQEEERGEGGDRAHGAGRVAAQAAASRGFARRARRFAGPGASRNASRSCHVVPAAARPVRTPRWPPGAVASSTRACGSSDAT